jgi:hypothetical protein
MVWLVPSAVQADPHSYAIVVGSTRGGAGQSPLEFAAQDAQRFAGLLIELGRTPKQHVQVMLDPSPEGVQLVLERLRGRLAAHAARGEGSKLIFYYSGHARSRALSLGDAELPLDELRKALLALPSTLTVVVLDACQSGAFSGVKGAAPAADFSTSSVFDLRSEGVAVMASSTAAELSQESSELGASYFTHHLITGLRGAGDLDRDGMVSLDEAYRYAYHNTLSDTLRTRVGSQHATLETELKGHGNVPLTFTSDADAQLLLPATVDGRIVIQQRGRGAVVAELSKSLGSSLSLALPHGGYEVLVRRGIAADVVACEVVLGRGIAHTLDTRGCPVAKLPKQLAKGGRNAYERWFIEVGVSWNFARDDAYVDTLKDFLFRDYGSPVGHFELGSFAPYLAGGLGFNRYGAVLARLDRLQAREFHRVLEYRSADSEHTRYDWQTWSIALALRGRWPFLEERVAPFAELGLGLGIGRDSFKYQDEEEVDETHFGPVVLAAIGTSVHLFWRIGLVAKVGYAYAPVLENLLKQSHDDGGVSFSLALRLRGLRGVE